MCISSIALIVFAIAALRHATQRSIDTTNASKPVPARATEAVKKVIDNMYDHLRREAPNDACALLDSLGQSWSLQANDSAQRTLSPKYSFQTLTTGTTIKKVQALKTETALLIASTEAKKSLVATLFGYSNSKLHAYERDMLAYSGSYAQHRAQTTFVPAVEPEKTCGLCQVEDSPVRERGDRYVLRH